MLPILTYGLRTHENQSQVSALIELAERQLHEGDKLTALKCLIMAADMEDFRLPENCALAAANLALKYCRTMPRFEAFRIAGCFRRLAYDEVTPGVTDESVFRLFENVMLRWSLNNILPVQRMTIKKNASSFYLLELSWNEGGDLHEPVPDKPKAREEIREFLKKRPMYLVELNPLKRSRPFHIGPMIRTDEDVVKAVRDIAPCGISYYTPKLRPVVDELVRLSGGDVKTVPEFNELPQSMSWYRRKMLRKTGRSVRRSRANQVFPPPRLRCLSLFHMRW